MNSELIPKILDWLTQHWHEKAGAFAAVLFSMGVVIWPFYSPQTQRVGAAGWVIASLVGLLILSYWMLTHRLERVKKGKVGIILGISCDSPDQDKKVRADFVDTLRALISSDKSHLQLVELPAWVLKGGDADERVENVLKKVRGHFMLCGRVRSRTVGGQPVQVLSFRGIVRHAPISRAESKRLSEEFSAAVPTKVIIDQNNDLFSFEWTSEWTDVGTRFVVGTAAFLSGDFEYAEKLLLTVRQRIEQRGSSNSGIRKVAQLLPSRLRQLYERWLGNLYSEYWSKHDQFTLGKIDEVSSKLLAIHSENNAGLLAKAICEFLLRRDVAKAHELLSGCHDSPDATWRYSSAFLHAYAGNMKKARRDYKRAFEGRVNVSVPVQCEEFIQRVLTEEPDKVQLHYCLGLINYYGKEDFASAQKDLVCFLERRNPGKFATEAKEAEKLLSGASIRLKAKE